MTEDTTQPETIEVDATLVLTEAILGVLQSMLALVPMQVDPHSIEHQRIIAQLQHGMNQIGSLAIALGSEVVQAKPSAPEECGGGSSGIILPR